MTAVLTPTPALVVDDLSLSFGGNHVLQQIALRLTPGEITGLIGPNGAGKTSFFNCLTGLYSPKGGAIRFGERRIERVAPADRAELGFSRSFQHVALCPDLSIAEVADALPASLPPGVLRLAEIARASVGGPRVLLLDEPAAGLNSGETRELASALKGLRSPQLVLVVVEHDMDLIMDVCDTIHVLNVGKLLASGNPESIRANAEVVRVYLGDDGG